MTQLNIRAPDGLVADLRAQAAARGLSMNAWVVAVLGAAANPDLAGSEAERTRERLALAGLLEVPGVPPGAPPDPAEVERARRAAGAGRPPSAIVAADRD